MPIFLSPCFYRLSISKTNIFSVFFSSFSIASSSYKSLTFHFLEACVEKKKKFGPHPARTQKFNQFNAGVIPECTKEGVVGSKA